MAIFIVCLFLLSFASFATFLILTIVDSTDVSNVVWLFVAIMSYLVGYVVFHKYTNKYPRNDISEFSTKDFKRLLIKKDNCFEIQFVKKDNDWICENETLSVKLNLNGYAFEKSYLISYVIRNLRYRLISNKRPLKYLFANKLFIKQALNVKLQMLDGNKMYEKMIVENGVSKYGFLARRITFSPFYLSGLSNRTYQSIRNYKTYIDESVYKRFFVRGKTKVI